MSNKTIYVGLDVDATIIRHCYPHMDGRDLGAIPWLKRLINEFNVVFILNTMRSGNSTVLAIEWLAERGIPIGYAGRHPTQSEWTTSSKAHCHVYIDDRNAGCPLDDEGSIDWDIYGPMVITTVQSLAERR